MPLFNPPIPDIPEIKVYADTSAFDAETQTARGLLTSVSWGAYTGISQLNSISGTALVETTVNTASQTVITQTIFIGGSVTGSATDHRVWRRKIGAADYTAWSRGYPVGWPVQSFEAVPKSYVDTFGVKVLDTWAQLDGLSGSGTGYWGLVKTDNYDIGAHLGVSLFNSDYSNGLLYEHHATWDNSAGAPAAVQILYVPQHDGTITKFTRKYQSSAWSAWVQVEASPSKSYVDDRSVKRYLTEAEVNAVGENGVSEVGLYRLPVGGAQTFFSGNTAVAYIGGDVFIQTLAGDGYGTGYPPTPGTYGALHQIAEMVDGYGTSYLFSRTRSWNSSSWDTWTAWKRIANISDRPSTSAGGLWFASSTSQGWRSIQPLDSVAFSQSNIPNGWQMAFAEWDVMETARLIHGSSPTWENFGGTIVNLGTQSYARRSPTPANQREGFSRVMWSEAAAVNAVAGFHMPLEAQSNRHGDMMVASYAIEPTSVATAQIYFGVVQTSQVASVIGDVSLQGLNSAEYWAVGYDNDDTTFKVYSCYTGSFSVADTGIAVTRNAGQIVTVKIRREPSSVTPSIQIIVTNASGGSRSVTLPLSRSAGPWFQPVSVFLRASAGGTSWAPKANLMKLQYGFGLVGGGGH